MSEPDNITRCPYCQTSFRVVEVQLQAANGAVRCGSCLQVFQARDYFVVVEVDAVTDPVTETVVLADHEPALSLGDIPEIEDDSEDDLEDQAVLKALVELEAPQAFVSLPESAWPASMEAADSTIQPGTDEVEIKALPDMEASLGDDWVAHYVEASAPLKAASAPAASWYNALDQAKQLPTDNAADPKPTAPELVSFDDDTNDSAPWGDETDLTNLNLAKLDVATQDPQYIVGEMLASRQKPWRWMIAGLVLLTMLVGQYAWYAKAVLAQDATLRPYFTSVCHYLGCRLPVYLNRRAIEATDLVVRSQKNNPPALIVDAIIKNSGAFIQVFPDLELQFTDAENRLIASRRFSPAEYLAGEVTGLSYFPAYTEVRLSLEIVDPGDDALGYSLAIAPDF